MKRRQSWSRRAGVILSAVLFLSLSRVAPALAGTWGAYQVANECSATQSSPISGVYWQVCSYGGDYVEYPGDHWSSVALLVTNTTGRNYYVQADLQLWSTRSLVKSDSCGTTLIPSYSRYSCSGAYVVIPYGANQQGRGRMAIAGQWDTWAWGQTWTFYP